jgi:hypothetical protein
VALSQCVGAHNWPPFRQGVPSFGLSHGSEGQIANQGSGACCLVRLTWLNPKTDASSKKRAGSREDALDASTRTEKAPSRTVRSATSGPLQLRAAWGSPWEKYEKIYDVELGGLMEVAVRKAPPVELVHVRAFATRRPRRRYNCIDSFSTEMSSPPSKLLQPTTASTLSSSICPSPSNGS